MQPSVSASGHDPPGGGPRALGRGPSPAGPTGGPRVAVAVMALILGLSMLAVAVFAESQVCRTLVFAAASIGLAGMAVAGAAPAPGKHAGTVIDISGAGKVELTHVLATGPDTAIYHTTHPGMVVKLFDLGCGKADEIKYGPYMSFGLEMANWEDIRNIDELSCFVPGYYGGQINYEKQFAYVAMEYLEGQNLKAWCEEWALGEYGEGEINHFKAAVYEALSIVGRFHRHGIILIDFKPDNIIRLHKGGIKFVDLGAFFTPRHHSAPEKYVYSATPDYAELLIDSLNVQSGLPPAEASDIFATGVALFEMATGNSRLEMNAETADEILANPGIFLFRDSQIRDLWKSYPHLKELLPLLQTQLRERTILFAEFWHLLKGYLANKIADWEALTSEQHDQVILATGTTFIQEQLPAELHWLAGPIAQATVLRSIRLKNVGELMDLIASPVPEEVRQDIERHSGLVQYARDLELSTDFVQRLNAWDVRLNSHIGRWAIHAPRAASHLSGSAAFTYLKETHREDERQRFFEVVTDLEADYFQEGKLNLSHLQMDHSAWLG